METVSPMNEVSIQNMTMPSTKQIRHHLSKQPLVDSVLTWLQHRNLDQHDVFVASYPRSGSTWLRFMLCELLTGEETSFDLVDSVVAGVGRHQKAPHILPDSGRLLQTHEPYRREYCRTIYLVRDVRSVVISEYIFCRRLRYFEGDFDEFFDAFLAGRVNRYGFWGDQVSSWVAAARKEPERVFVLRYEDLRANTAAIMKECLQFLQVERPQEMIERTIENHSLEKMRAKEGQATKFKDNAHGLHFIAGGDSKKKSEMLTVEQEQKLIARAAPVLEHFDYLHSTTR
jgi:hypothetical protein